MPHFQFWEHEPRCLLKSLTLSARDRSRTVVARIDIESLPYLALSASPRFCGDSGIPGLLDGRRLYLPLTAVRGHTS